MGKKFDVPLDTVIIGSIACYHNDLFNPELFEITQKALPSFGNTDFILVELNNDDGVDRLRSMAKGRDVLVRKAPGGTRWNGSKGHVCVVSRVPGFRDALKVVASAVVGRRIIL